jgi:hypothetical protein
MSLASAVVLLQTALSLLTLVNSNPSLPQLMRDNATAVAQQGIAQVTLLKYSSLLRRPTRIRASRLKHWQEH